jgi:hypothetical protein
VAATSPKFHTATVLLQIIVSVQIITHVLQSLFMTLTLTLFGVIKFEASSRAVGISVQEIR